MRDGVLFITALIIAAGACENMCDSPLAFAIAVGALVTLAITGRRMKQWEQ